MKITGIDISSRQSSINWDEVTSSEINFAMIRSSFGTNGLDKRYYENVQNATAEGINCGAYHYTYATNTFSAQNEANYFLSLLAPYSFSYPVALDIEDNSLISLGKKAIIDIALTFCQTVESAGYYVCIHSNLDWFLNYLDMTRLSQFDIWLTQYSSNPSLSYNFGIWKYGVSDSVKGISGNVDMNISYKDYPSIISSSGLNGVKTGFTPSTPLNPPVQGGTTHIVVNDDTLVDIAQKYGTTISAIIAANPQITNPDLICAGQVITIPYDCISSSDTT